MKYYLYFLLFSVQLISVNLSVSAASIKNEISVIDVNKKIKKSDCFNTTSKIQKKVDIKKWLPLGLGILGLALIFIPYISIIGLIAGVAAVITGFLFRKKYPKTARWGIWLGGICIVAFLAVLGLVLFF
jgi:hypothetical protein